MDYTSQGQASAEVMTADEQRTKRMFVGFLSSALGIDQTYANEDGYVGNASGQYIIANPDGTYSKVGQSVSNQNNGSAAAGLVLTPGLLMVGALIAFLMFKK
jgi:t-SNARE complex subunit (syntaxin)